jgi:hypothetical protein
MNSAYTGYLKLLMANWRMKNGIIAVYPSSKIKIYEVWGKNQIVVTLTTSYLLNPGIFILYRLYLDRSWLALKSQIVFLGPFFGCTAIET